jgi:hypothetical protein
MFNRTTTPYYPPPKRPKGSGGPDDVLWHPNEPQHAQTANYYIGFGNGNTTVLKIGTVSLTMNHDAVRCMIRLLEATLPKAPTL